MPTSPSVAFEVHFPRETHGRRARTGPPPAVREPLVGLPRQVKLLALAHHLDRQLQRGVFRDYAHIAEVAGLTRARITQIMGLLLLPVPVQEEMLLNPEVARGWTDRDVQRMVGEVEWEKVLQNAQLPSPVK